MQAYLTKEQITQIIAAAFRREGGELLNVAYTVTAEGRLHGCAVEYRGDVLVIGEGDEDEDSDEH